MLRELVAEELGGAVDSRVIEMALALVALYPRAARAVLFYGSCLRATELDGQMLDFYLIVSSYDEAYARSWLATANRLIPPNVFPFQLNGLAAKYAVMSEADFARDCSDAARTVSVWARFAQPSRLVWAKDDAARRDVVRSVAQAAPTLLARALPLAGSSQDNVLSVWKIAFSQTYRAELRAERSDRSASIVDADPNRYRRFGDAALRNIDRSRLPAADVTIAEWRTLQCRGKRESVARLAKASFTFAGGIDYLAWKIGRHSGQTMTIRPWHRRFPLLAAIVLVPRLLVKGAVR